jgi:hypothetical protein
MNHNPFDQISDKLNKLESLIINLSEKEPPKQPQASQFRYVPIQDIFDEKVCSKPTFYKHLKAGKFTLYKFGNKSFVDKEEFEGSFTGITLKGGNK